MAEVFEASAWRLPVEVLEMVLAQLPLPSLLTVHSRVCSYWSEVIQNPSFIPWKKIYYRLKLAPKSESSAFLLSPSRVNEKLSSEEIMNELCVLHGVTSLEDCIVNIVKLMGSVHGVPFASEGTITTLKRHPLYDLAMSALENLEEGLVPKPYNVWHMVAMIALISQDMWHVDSLLQILMSQGSVFTPRDVTEGFYCLAAFLSYCKKKFDLPTRYHYIVHYAVYLFENRWMPGLAEDPEKLRKGHSGQQSIHQFGEYKPKVQNTHEQSRIINHDLQEDHIVKIVAFAGTGKTTTLLQMCKQRPHQRFLLVVYNKSVQEHCAKTFPRNVKVQTAHAMAFASAGRRFAALKKLDGGISTSKVADFLERKEGSGNRFRRAALTKNTIEMFLNSADEYLTLQHVPTKDKQNEELDDDFRLKVLLDDAEQVWKEMKRCSGRQQVPMSQDGSLKCWQLSKPKLKDFDVIMIDEGQDMNPAMFDVFLTQDCAKVIVGDPHQQIYSFRGAVNALDVVPATHTFYLTQSFRFGPEISYLAHCVLETVKKVSRQTLVGGRKQDEVFAAPTAELTRNGEKLKRAYLARLNISIYKFAIQMCLKEDPNAVVSMAFAGGVAKYNFDMVLDIYKLSQAEQGYGTPETLQIKNKLVAKFKSVSSLKKFAENIEDFELANKIKMYEFSGKDTARHISLLNSRCCASPGAADITFSTIHKAKGLEFDWVIMLDDLIPVSFPTRGLLLPDFFGDEVNLMYVAMTRAKFRLTINTAVLYTLTKAKERFEQLVCREEINADTSCIQCGSSFADYDYPLVTQVKTIPIGNDKEQFSGGFICNICMKFEKFIPPQTVGFPMTQIYTMDDSCRLARRVLISGKKEHQPVENHQRLSWNAYHADCHSFAVVQRIQRYFGDDDEEEMIFLLDDQNEPELPVEVGRLNRAAARRRKEPELVDLENEEFPEEEDLQNEEPEVIELD